MKGGAMKAEKAVTESVDHTKSTAAEEVEKATDEKPADALKKALQKKAEEKAPAVSK